MSARDTLDAELRRQMGIATLRARAELGAGASVTCVLQVLDDDVLRVFYCVGITEAGRFVQRGIGSTWSEALERAKTLAAEGG